MEYLPLRLMPQQDLKRALLEECEQHKIEAAFVLGCVGSLTQAVIRFANQKEGTTLLPTWEILTLSGTLSRHGAHLHITLSDKKGRVLGGHLMEGSLIHTTAEVILGILPQHTFTREPDPHTGYLELVISPQESTKP